MTNIQLGLFGDQIVPPNKKANRVQRYNGRKVDAIANQILRKIKTETKETQQKIVCEMYCLTVCEKLDLMPERIVENFIVKLIERYFTLRENK